MTPAYAMLPTITVCVAEIEFTVGTPDLKYLACCYSLRC